MKTKTILFGLIMGLLLMTFNVQAKAQKELVCADTLSGWEYGTSQSCIPMRNITLCKNITEWTPIFENTCLSKSMSVIYNQQFKHPKVFEILTEGCKKDSDCMTSQQSLCPCSSGGREVAVNQIGKTIYDFMWLSNPQAWAVAPNELMCMQVYNCQTPKCIGNRCQLIPYY